MIECLESPEPELGDAPMFEDAPATVIAAFDEGRKMLRRTPIISVMGLQHIVRYPNDDKIIVSKAFGRKVDALRFVEETEDAFYMGQTPQKTVIVV